MDKSAEVEDIEQNQQKSKDDGIDNPGYTPPEEKSGQTDAPSPAVYDFNEEKGNSEDKIEPEDDVEKEKQRKRDRKPLMFISLITNHLGIFFGLFFAGHIILLLVTVILLRSGYDIIPLEFDRLPLDIRDDVDYLRDLAWTERNDDDNKIIKRGKAASTTKDDERTIRNENFDMLFEAEGGNVFTKENLKAIKQVEDEFLKVKDYNDYCLLAGSPYACTKPQSVIRIFDGSSFPLPADLEFNNIPGYLYTVYSTDEGKQFLQRYLSKDAVITATKAESSITRSLISMGYPLKGYDNKTHKEDEQTEKYSTFLGGDFKALADKYYKDKVGPNKMGFYYSSPEMFGITILGQVPVDMALAVGSFVYIGLFMLFQVRSLWIVFMSLFSIITCFLGANIVYRVFLDFRYFGIFHVLALFIILGIGADDIFVFLDTWRESEHHNYKSLAHRMSDVYRKASMAMLFTSVTTAIAFFVSGTSPFLGISSFGIFSGILVIVNYISVITFFPCAVLMYHKYFEKFKCCCCCPKPHTVEPDAETSKQEVKQNMVVRFLKGPYYRFVTHKVARVVILIVFAIILAIFIYFATTLKVNEEQVKFYPDSSNIEQYRTKSSEEFSAAGRDFSSKVIIAFGLKPQDISECHKTDPACYGKTVWDNNFSLDSTDAQADILAICTQLKNLDDQQANLLRVRRSILNNELEVNCFMSAMRDKTFTGGYINYPFDAADWNQLKMQRSDVYTDTSFSAGFQDYFAISMGYWIYDEFNGQKTTREKYDLFLGEVETGDTKYTSKNGESIMYGTRLRYAAIVVNITIENTGINYNEGLDVRTLWEEWVSARLANTVAKDKLGGFQTADGLWHWYKVQQNLLRGAVTGIIVGLAVACPILIIATHNVLIGLLATLIICFITVSVVGVIPMAGWKLGLLESLNLVLVVGLAVDYVVHLAEGYSRSAHQDRKSRVKDMLEEVGISVLSGACTTLGASFFLLFTVILFFTQFGIFMFCTIGFAISYSLILFATILGMIGPQGETGSLKPLYRKISACCCKKKNEASLQKENEASK